MFYQRFDFSNCITIINFEQVSRISSAQKDKNLVHIEIIYNNGKTDFFDIENGLAKQFIDCMTKAIEERQNLIK